MYGLGYERWTQREAAGSGADGLLTLLRLARENETSLRADLKEVAAARSAAAGSLAGAGQDARSENRRYALRRLLNNLERSEASIRERLAAMQAETETLDRLIGRSTSFDISRFIA